MSNQNQSSGRIKKSPDQRPGMPLPEAGRVKIGIKVANSNPQKKDYPMSLDYFRATGTFAQHFHKVLGDKPDKLTIVFISDNVADSCNEEYACWENGKRWGFGDGETFTVWDSKAKEYIDGVPATDERVTAKKWDIMLTLRFVIPELKGVLGHWVFSTKGAKTTIPSIVKSFDFIKERMGTVIGVPFEFVVEKVKGYSPTDPKQYSKVKLIPCFSEEYMLKVKQYLESGRSLAQIAPLMVTEAKMLASSPRTEDVPAISIETVTEQKTAKPGDDNLPLQVTFDIENATSVEHLEAIYKENFDLQQNQLFVTALSNKKAKIKKGE